RGDDPGADAAPGAADMRAPGVVGRLVQLQPEPGGVAADTGADGGGVLADAAREHQRVQSAQGGGQRSQLAADTVDEQVDGLGRLRGRAGEDGAQVAGNP